MDEPTISVQKLCDLTGLQPRTLRQLRQEGYLPPLVKGECALGPAISGVFKYFREQQSKRVVMDAYDSIGHCSAATGIPVAVIRHAKKSGCTEGFSSNRVLLVPLIRWLFSKQGEESGIDWGAEFKMWQAKREKIKHDRDDRAVISRDEVEEGIRKHISYLFAEVERVFVNELPASVKGLDAAAISVKARAVVENLKAILRTRFEALANP